MGVGPGSATADNHSFPAGHVVKVDQCKQTFCGGRLCCHHTSGDKITRVPRSNFLYFDGRRMGWCPLWLGPLVWETLDPPLNIPIKLIFSTNHFPYLDRDVFNCFPFNRKPAWIDRDIFSKVVLYQLCSCYGNGLLTFMISFLLQFWAVLRNSGHASSNYERQ